MPLTDNFLPGQGFTSSDSVVNALGYNGMALPSGDWSRLRQPYLDKRGRACVTIHDLDGGYTRNDSHGGEKKKLLRNYLMIDLLNRGYPLPLAVNAATLTKEQWIELDRTVIRAARQELTAAADLESRSPLGGFDAYARSTFEYQAYSDAGAAYVDMDLATDGTTDTPLSILRSLPLPCTHSDFGYTDRELRISQNNGPGFDRLMAEMATRRVSESVEDNVIGNVTGMTYATQTAGPGTHTGTSTVYGYRTFPQRLTKTNFTAPTAGGWTPETTFNEVLAAIQQLLNQYFRGPFIMYHSLDWNQYMNRQFSIAGGNNAGETLRTMLLKIPQISDVKLLERLTTTFTFIFVQMTNNVAQMVVGRDIGTIQWQLKGGIEHRWKVWCIKVPLLRSDYNSRTGILHGTTA